MNPHHPTLLAAALLFTLALALGPATAASEPAPRLASVAAQAATGAHATGFDGVVEAVRQSVIAAQVPGAVVQLAVKVGDRVTAGQVLVRIDARAAEQNAVASDAQVQAARATLDVAAKDFERQQQLFKTNFISQAALERAESEFKANQAQVNAQLAQAGAARTQSGLHVVRAPFAGIVSEVPVSLGDMAMPGRALLTLYDPAALRISAAVPQSALAQWAPGQPVSAELPGLPNGRERVAPSQVQVLPAVDASTHTAQLRADLPSGLAGVSPGMFARLWLSVAGAGAGGEAPTVTVPLVAIVRRAELTALYVLDPAGRPALRQVRLGRLLGDRVEILAGVTAGESVATDPQAAARVR